MIKNEKMEASKSEFIWRQYKEQGFFLSSPYFQLNFFALACSLLWNLICYIKMQNLID